VSNVIDEMFDAADGPPARRPREHECCFHISNAPALLVMRDGHVLMRCCVCTSTKQVHRDHARSH
jgi:hypothetical protein